MEYLPFALVVIVMVVAIAYLLQRLEYHTDLNLKLAARLREQLDENARLHSLVGVQTELLKMGEPIS